MAANTNASPRSVSRGRESFGRGGFGNMRDSSATRDIKKPDGPDDFSPARGREPVPHHRSDGVFSTGRGGAGNLRSPSREPVGPNGLTPDEQEVINRHRAEEKLVVSGRGGLGNIENRSRSRGPATLPEVPELHSTGRGGLGNAVRNLTDNQIEEEERIARLSQEKTGIHSTGRGGYSNMTSGTVPPVEHLIHLSDHDGGYHSTGRGGAGNMTRERSTDGRSKERQGGVSGLWHRVTGSRDHSTSPSVAGEAERGRER